MKRGRPRGYSSNKELRTSRTSDERDLSSTFEEGDYWLWFALPCGWGNALRVRVAGQHVTQNLSNIQKVSGLEWSCKCHISYSYRSVGHDVYLLCAVG